MIRKAIAICAVLAAALTVTMSAGAVPCCFTNGSFELNNTSGWTSSGGGFSTGSAAGGAPLQGSYYGWANTGDSAATFGGLSQTSFGPPGWIRGWAKFDNGEPGGFCGFNDEARVLVDGNQLFYASSYSTGSTGWVKFSTYVSSGAHTVTAEVLNDTDSICDSQINLDGVLRDVRAGWPSP